MTDEPACLPSPVPSDDRLADGQLPFTAFGQFGEGAMDNRVFDQDEYWVDVHGTGHRIDEMPADYRRNVIIHLLSNATYFHLNALLRLMATLVDDLQTGQVSGDLLARLAGERTEDMDPITWLESTPLMRRLRTLAPDAPRVDESLLLP